jgi:EAL domain-containing protein (putative c-di-GMP-specific phosphodiesterase class I)
MTDLPLIVDPAQSSLSVLRAAADRLIAAAPIPREEMEQALAGHELTLLYQPKIALHPDAVTIQGVEALVRWQHPRRGWLRPADFLGAAERHGLMTALTDFVLTDAIRQAGQWRAQGMPLETVVNLTPRLVRDREFPHRLASVLREHGVPASQLMLDIAEAPSADDHNLTLEVFSILRIMGVGLSLDNFGTGRLSLTELHRMPYSEIKIDRSLLDDAQSDGEARHIVRAVIELAHALGLSVSAEGVETGAMFEYIRAAGFDNAQGHFFCAPVDAGQIERIVRGWQRWVPAAAQSSPTPMQRPLKREGG